MLGEALPRTPSRRGLRERVLPLVNEAAAPTHERILHERFDTSRTTLPISGQFRYIGISIGICRSHKGTQVVLLMQGLDIGVPNDATGELVRELTTIPSRTTSPELQCDQHPNPQSVGPRVRDVLRHHRAETVVCWFRTSRTHV